MLYSTISYELGSITSATPCMICETVGHAKGGVSKPIKRLRPPASPEAAMLGTNLFSLKTRKTRSRVAGSTFDFWLRTRETVDLETPARRAISCVLSFDPIVSSASYIQYGNHYRRSICTKLGS